MPVYKLNNDIDLVIWMIHEVPYLDNIPVHIYVEYLERYGAESSKHGYQCHFFDRYLVKGKSVPMVELFSGRDDGHMIMWTMRTKYSLHCLTMCLHFWMLHTPEIIICTPAVDMKCWFQLTCFQKQGWILRNDLSGTSSIKVMEETICVCILVE